ncbi:MAG: type II toxin-antitoxin system RelE/ParE family toxin [Hyphomonadaceae bacterium]
MKPPLSVRWSLAALDEYDASVARLREQNPAAAIRYVEALGDAIALLARRPNTGRKGRVEGTREKSLPKWRYVIAYQVSTDEAGAGTLDILHIIHTSRDWPVGEWPKG